MNRGGSGSLDAHSKGEDQYRIVVAAAAKAPGESGVDAALDQRSE